MSPPGEVATDVPEQETFMALLNRLWLERHTGRVVLHFQSGRASAVEIQPPGQLIRLDKDA